LTLSIVLPRAHRGHGIHTGDRPQIARHLVEACRLLLDLIEQVATMADQRDQRGMQAGRTYGVTFSNELV